MNDLKPAQKESFSELKDGKPAESKAKESIERVAVKSGGRIYFLKIEEIDWVEAAGDYLSLHAGSGTHLIRETMENFHAKLDAKKFLRIHRSTIVNIVEITRSRLLTILGQCSSLKYQPIKEISKQELIESALTLG